MSSKKPSCFVIQEFDDGGTFDKRYKDIIEPTLKSLDVVPLRADEILGLNPIIEKIENAIKKADLCIAEVSTDNPNVWMELGYAFALKKPTIMLFDKSKRERLPFDVQHLPAIPYSSDSKRSFEELEENLKQYVANEINSVPKVSLSTAPGNKIDLLKKQLKVMCWESNKWKIYPLDKLTIRTENDVLIIINKTYIHRFARLIYDKKLAGDFNSIISLKGNYRSIGLFTANGEDRTMSIRPSDQSIDVKNKHNFEISRKDSNIKFQTSEGKRLYCKKYRAHEDMEFCTGLSIINDAKVKIYSWEVEGA
ncbi:MAG: hypothetical protein KAT34_18600 [Candidatus Aminicenantes bacterium]|nr:hypothetical protein [Candidatus Aminicenantes bacterium]